MKRVFAILCVLSLAITFTSCDKWEAKPDKKGDYYVSDNYKEAEGEVLNTPISDITTLYSVFFYEGKMLKYKLVVNTEASGSTSGCFDKGDDDVNYEEGQAQVDDQLNITFIPDSNPNDRYYGYFENEKKNYKVTIPSADSRELNFNLK